jgi:Skp family chaperone for outer membrane proteins
MWKVPIMGLLIASTAALGATVGTSRTHVAYVSLQRIAAQTKIGQASAKRLDTARQEKSRALAEKQQKVEALRLQIAQNGGVFYRSRREELQKQEEKERAEFDRLKETAQSDILAVQRDVQSEFQSALKSVLVDLANERDADVVLNADTAVVWAKPGFDLTDDAIKRVDGLEAARPKK